MPTCLPAVDAYIDRQPPFAQPLLLALRSAFHEGCPGLHEAIKWGCPCFEHHGLLGGIAAFKAHVGWGLWRAEELDDPHDLLGRAEGGSVMRVKVRTPEELPEHHKLVALVQQAARLNEHQPAKARRSTRTTLTAPNDLRALLDAHPAARVGFDALAPSHQQEYLQWIEEAKRPQTRAARLEKTVTLLAEGKTKNWKYGR